MGHIDEGKGWMPEALEAPRDQFRDDLASKSAIAHGPCGRWGPGADHVPVAQWPCADAEPRPARRRPQWGPHLRKGFQSIGARRGLGGPSHCIIMERILDALELGVVAGTSERMAMVESERG